MFPNFIKKNFGDLNAIIESGDWEVAISNYIDFIKGKNFSDGNIPGITIKDKDRNKWIDATRCSGENFTGWAFTDLDSKLVDVNLYKSLRHNEVTISASRGCPYNCKFCLAVKTFDKDDRRKNIGELVQYMNNNVSKVSDFKLFSPTFTYDEEWVMSFCKELINNKINATWVTTSRTDKLQNEEMIEKMAEAGCKKLAVGVETLDERANRELKKFNDLEDYRNKVENMFKLANKYNIEIKPLLMMGIKGQSKENILDSLNFLTSIGARDIRIAAYSPRQLLTELDNKGTLTLKDINACTKKYFWISIKIVINLI